MGWEGEGVESVAEEGTVESEAKAMREGLCSGLGGEWNSAESSEPSETSGRVPAESLGLVSSGTDMMVDLH